VSGSLSTPGGPTVPEKEWLQPPIADYALIGDGRTAALISSAGSIDWLCVPRFDSEPVFGRLVGGPRAGSFSILVDDIRHTTRRYREGSAVLETTHRTTHGEVRLTEGMVLDVSSRLAPRMLLVRRVECRTGPATVRIRFDPRLGLGGGELPAERRFGHLLCRRGATMLALRVSPDPEIVPGEERAVSLAPDAVLNVLLTLSDREPVVFVPPDAAVAMLETTERWWQRWSEGIRYDGPNRDAVVRSLITLRLLTYAPSGAPVAAPTTSLPEALGGSRNWDYRYAWPRDASIGLAAFLAVDKPEEADSFFHWLFHASRLTRPRLRAMYTLDGKRTPEERDIPEAEGYRQTRPVRVGNAAWRQHQLDVYGWVLDAAWFRVDAGHPLHSATWRAMSAFTDFVAKHWRDPDAGVWEMRGPLLHHVHSKLMAWLALDRALRIARTHSTRAARRRRWASARDAIAAEVRDRGFSERLGSYVSSYGSEELDAALLLLPILEFEDPRSPRVASTVDAIRRHLSAGGPLLYRYAPASDSLEGSEGAFLACSFWLVQALARLGRREEAVRLFGDLCARGNDVGLFAEEIDPASGEHLGNFPQALTHAALVQAALALEEATAARGRPRGSPRRRRAPPA
jgi:GH15 family glucan-1,4-alpha-glucosidase